MKRENKKVWLKIIFVLTLLFILIPSNQVKAATLKKEILKIGMVNDFKSESCKIDLNGDGKKEKVSLKVLSEEYDRIQKFRIAVNGKSALTISKVDAYHVYIDYIGMSKKNIFLRIYAIADDGALTVDSFYRYDSSEGKFVKETKLLFEQDGWCVGAEISAVSKKNVKIVYRNQFSTVGSVQWTFTYAIKDGKMKLDTKTATVKSNLFANNEFTAAKTVHLYTGTSLKKSAFTASKGEVLTLEKIKYSGGKYYGKFSKGKNSGWMLLDSGDYSVDSKMFYGVEERLVG